MWEEAKKFILEGIVNSDDIKKSSVPLDKGTAQLGELGAKLASLAYESSEVDVKAGLAERGLMLLHFEVGSDWTAESFSATHPQWYLAGDSYGMLYLVFRGTNSRYDVFRDIVATPVKSTTTRQATYRTDIAKARLVGTTLLGRDGDVIEDLIVRSRLHDLSTLGRSADLKDPTKERPTPS